MRYLVHGIFEPGLEWPRPEMGVCVIEAHGLAAAVRRVEEGSSARSVTSLLEYGRVVEAMHARGAVIPLRYGCLMESESAIGRLLDDHRQEYEALLGRLRGMTEMGIRLLWPPRTRPSPESSSSPGSRYVASLRNRYTSGDSLAGDEAQLADEITALLRGCYTEQRREVSPSNRGRLVSLYYLTPKDGVERWRQAARHVCPPSGVKSMISGPWPPYNFVVSPG
jgi:hypothetical protein